MECECFAIYSLFSYTSFEQKKKKKKPATTTKLTTNEPSVRFLLKSSNYICTANCTDTSL